MATETTGSDTPFSPEQLAWLSYKFGNHPQPYSRTSGDTAGTTQEGSLATQEASELSDGDAPSHASTLAGLPIFTPSAGPPSTGLELLAAAASNSAVSDDPPTIRVEPGDLGLNKPGPFNPAASLAPKVAKKILELDFVEMADVTIDAAPEPTASRPFTPSRPPVTNISQWTERFATMAALLSQRFPAKAPELFAYLATVVRAERNYEAGRWAAYDRQYRREALAKKSLDWSVPDQRLYNEAFTGRAKAIPRCAVCLMDDHQAHNCPQGSNQSWLGWPGNLLPWGLPQMAPAPGSSRPSRRSNEVCRRFNEGRCRMPTCRYVHTCTACGGEHPAIQCGRVRQRDRSPVRSAAPQARGPSGWARL